jgi:hypothetical protein
MGLSLDLAGRSINHGWAFEAATVYQLNGLQTGEKTTRGIRFSDGPCGQRVTLWLVYSDFYGT